METKRFILLDIDYFTKKGKPIVRLFGKLPDGRSIIALDKNFKPYIYVIPHDIDECISELDEFKIPRIEKIRKTDNGELKDLLKLTLEHPRDIAKLEKKISELKFVESVREYDITFPRRYLIDKGLFPMSEVEVQGKVLKRAGPNGTCIIELQEEPKHIKSDLPDFNILSFKIEACNPKGQPQVKKDPVNIISFTSNLGFQKVFSTKKSSSNFVETVQNEKELLNKFVETIKFVNPDVILGYNSDKFDFPYLKTRADLLGVSLNIGVDGSKIRFITVPKKSAMVKGRPHVDIYRIVRRHLQLNSHTVTNVYFELFGEDKIDIPMDQMYTCWVDGGEKLERLFKYSLEDTTAVSKIGEKMLPMNIELTKIVGQTLFEIVRRGTGTQVKWLLIRKSNEFGHICPNEPGKFERGVVGGYVKEPVSGLYENIHYFDFRSLYPSIIIAKNISPETLCEDGDEETCHIAPEFFYKFKKEPKGFIPTVTAEILNDRIRIKSLMEESIDPKEKQVLNFRQEALKTLISTIYGLYNHPKYRWYCVEASEAITAWGREFLKDTMRKAERHGFKVLYADTDGFFVTSKYEDTIEQ